MVDLEIEIYKEKMNQARAKGNWKAFNDLKKHYDKLIKESKNGRKELQDIRR